MHNRKEPGTQLLTHPLSQKVAGESIT